MTNGVVFTARCQPCGREFQAVLPADASGGGHGRLQCPGCGNEDEVTVPQPPQDGGRRWPWSRR